MKTMRYLSAFIAVFMLAGCTTPFRPWNLSHVQEGMDRSDVIAILGPPESIEEKDGAEYLHYSYQEDYNPSSASIPFYEIDSDRAFRDLETERAFKQYEYVVILTDGKVINYKEIP